MDEPQQPSSRMSTGMWILVLVCTGAIILALTSGAAYTGISNARLSAAKASCGQIESVFLLAEKTAQGSGLRPKAENTDNLLKSYEDTEGAALSEYEKFVLDYMLETFGPSRDFDFAVKRFEDGTGVHTQIYYFPVKGRTNLSNDRYYVTTDGKISENNDL